MRWVKEMEQYGFNISTSLTKDTSYAHFGDAEMGHRVTEIIMSEKKPQKWGLTRGPIKV